MGKPPGTQASFLHVKVVWGEGCRCETEQTEEGNMMGAQPPERAAVGKSGTWAEGRVSLVLEDVIKALHLHMQVCGVHT